jgi:hypothetical protein
MLASFHFGIVALEAVMEMSICAYRLTIADSVMRQLKEKKWDI